MRKWCILLAALLAAWTAGAQEVSVEAFRDAIDHWNRTHAKDSFVRYTPAQFREIGDNLIAYQNADGGWPKNIDMTVAVNPDSVRRTMDAKHLRSTLDNANTHSQIAFLAEVYTLTEEVRYRDAAVRGMEYILATQYDNGGWRGWDVDAITYNDGIMYGVMSIWLSVVNRKSPFAWVDEALRDRVVASWERALALVLDTQWVQEGRRTVWAQQYDHQSRQPVKARAYELPALSSAESADITLLLMRISKPSAEVVAAVEAAVTWFERSKICGKRLVTVSLAPEEREDPKVNRDRRLVDDPEATPLWARYYDLADNRPFFSSRTGAKLYSLAEVPPERRVGYAWYGPWGQKVLDKYPEWVAKRERDAAKAAAKAAKEAAKAAAKAKK